MAKQKNEYVQLGGILCGITLVVALVLGGVNAVTVGPIAANNEKTTQDALAALIPDCEAEQLDVPEGTTADGYSATVEIASAYKMTDANGEVAGYCIEVTPTGFGGAVDTMVGILPDGTVAGIKILSCSGETPGLGAKATEEEFYGQFAGQPADGSVKVAKDGGEIAAITGATITSRAVTNGVDAAASYAASLS
ncbi:MAG: RnfABCDGE type electron transport complex subunit G [Eubacteriales bacterium]|nr:RnfABCDGE type electron transport complex subunit G [Eubacteriales bacterium]